MTGTKLPSRENGVDFEPVLHKIAIFP